MITEKVVPIGMRATVPILEWDDLLAVKAPDYSIKARTPLPTDIAQKHHIEFALRVENDAMHSENNEFPSYPRGSLIYIDTKMKAPEANAVVLARIHSDTLLFGVYEPPAKRHARIVLANPALPSVDLCCCEPQFLGTVVGGYRG